MTPTKRKLLGLLLLVGALYIAFGDGINLTVPGLSTKPTAVTYIYEKDDNAVPNPVLAALDKLNDQKIVANVFEQDTKDGSGDTPDQYKVALKAAKDAGLPAAVATSGDKVLKVVKNPQSEEDILGVAL